MPGCFATIATNQESASTASSAMFRRSTYFPIVVDLRLRQHMFEDLALKITLPALAEGKRL